MTVRLLVDFKDPADGKQYVVGNLYTSAANESGMIASKMATSDLTGGTSAAIQTVRESVDETKGIVLSRYPSGNIKGVVDPANGRNISIAMRNGFVRKGRGFKGNYGRRIALWSGASLQNSAGTAALVTTSDLPPIPDAATKVLKLTQNAAQSFGQQIVETADYTSPSASIENVGFWAKNTSGVTLSCELNIYNAAGSSSTRWNFAIDPCDWTFFAISPSANLSGGFVWGTDAAHFVRISQRDAGGDAWPAGASCMFSTVYIGTKSRARFMLCNDDGRSTIVHPGNVTSGWPATGRTYRDIVEAYGFKGTLYIVPSLIGSSGYLTQSELLQMQDLGWAIGSHSWTHPAYSNRGLTSLGPVGYADPSDTYHSIATNDDATIYADIMKGVDGLNSLGIINAGDLFALPQGTWDAYVRSAVMRSGVKHVRGVGSAFHSLSIGVATGGGGAGSSLIPGGWMLQGDAVQTDGTPTLGDCTAYVDACIAYGATGANYHHGTGMADSAVIDGLCSYLKTKQDAGLIEVVTASQAAWDDGLI